MDYIATDSRFRHFWKIFFCKICHWVSFWCLFSSCWWSWKNTFNCRWEGL